MARPLLCLAALALTAAACTSSSPDEPEASSAEIDPVADPAPGSFVVAVDFESLDPALGLTSPGAVVVDGDGSVLVAGERGAVALGGTTVADAGGGAELAHSMALTGAGAVVGTGGAGTISLARTLSGDPQVVAGASRRLAGPPFAPGAQAEATEVGMPLVLDATTSGDVVYAALRFVELGEEEVSQVVRVQDGTLELVAGSRPQDCQVEPAAPATLAGLGRAGGVAVDRSGALLIADGDCAQLWRVGPEGLMMPATPGGALADPLDVVTAPDGTAYVLDLGLDAVVAVAPDGTTREAVSGLSDADTSSQLALDGEGRLWITAGSQLLLAQPA